MPRQEGLRIYGLCLTVKNDAVATACFPLLSLHRDVYHIHWKNGVPGKVVR